MASQSVLFQELRPLCIGLSRQAFLPSNTFDPHSLELLNSLEQLESKLASYQDESLSLKLAEYTFVPIVSLLKQTGLGDSQAECVLRIIAHLLRLSWRPKGALSKELAEELLPLLTFLIDVDKANSKIHEKSSDYRRAGCGVLLQLFISLKEQPYKSQFFSSSKPKSLTCLGHCITLLLEIFESTLQDPRTQVQALETLRILYEEILDDGEILSFVLPGNVSSFVKILANPGIKTNYRTIVKTLQVLGMLLGIVYDDIALDAHRAHFSDVKELITFKESNPEIDINRRISMHLENPSQHRSLKWLLGTSSQVKRAIDSFIPKLLKRENENIRDALTCFASMLLKRCNNSLSNCEVSLLSILISLRRDPYCQLPEHLECLKRVVEEKTANIKTFIKLEDEQALLSMSFVLNTLAQCDSAGEFASFEDISGNIIEALEFEVASGLSRKHTSKIVEQSSNVILAGNLETQIVHCERSTAVFPRISKKLEDIIGELLMSAGRRIGNESALLLAIETALSRTSYSTRLRKILVLWSSVWALKGLYAERQPNDEVNDFLNASQNEEHTFEPCYTLLEFSNELSEEVVMAQEGRTMMLQEEIALSTVLFTLESMCQLMHKKFESELIDHLYTAVENLASPSTLVRHFSQLCLLTISQEIYNGSVQQVLLSNVDYLVDSISTRLNLGMPGRISAVLAVICKIAGYQTIETFKDVIETIFRMLDYYHGYSELCIEFFRLFEIIILEMKKSFLPFDEQLTVENYSVTRSAYSPWCMRNVQQLIDVLAETNTQAVEQVEDESNKEPSSFQEYFDSKVHEIDSDDEEENQEDEENEKNVLQGSGEQWSSPIPPDSYRVLLQIFHYGDRLLMHPSRPLRVQILQVMTLIIPMISTQYDSMLPQVASVWETLVQCTLSSDYTIVKPACLSLQEIIRYSGDFISKRFFDLWDCWCQQSVLLREVRTFSGNNSDSMGPTNSLIVPHRKFPPVTKDALIALANLLLEGVSVTELRLPDTTLTDMLHCCIQILPATIVAERSPLLADIVWMLQNVN